MWFEQQIGFNREKELYTTLLFFGEYKTWGKWQSDCPMPLPGFSCFPHFWTFPSKWTQGRKRWMVPSACNSWNSALIELLWEIWGLQNRWHFEGWEGCMIIYFRGWLVLEMQARMKWSPLKFDDVSAITITFFVRKDNIQFSLGNVCL